MLHYMGVKRKPWQLALRDDVPAPCHVHNLQAHAFTHALSLDADTAFSPCKALFWKRRQQLNRKMQRCANLTRGASFAGVRFRPF